MNLNILNNKIENIRKKPESVRLLYVWGMVAFFMSFVFLIWITSLKQKFSHSNNEVAEKKESIQKQVQGVLPESNSIYETIEKTKKSLEHELKQMEQLKTKNVEENDSNL